jgi:hypothetical protein
LPDGTTGLSGAIVDPHTTNGVNNTVNRIQLVDGVPGTFYLHVLVDNTGGAHDSSRVQARGNIGTLDDDNQVDPLSYPGVGGTCLAFNGVPDIYTFRFEGFAAGDYMKLRLQGGPDRVASFGGLLFDDESFEPHGRHRNAPGAEWRSPDEC